MSFTRWGRITCPNTEGTQLLYQGTMAGSRYNEPGSAEYLCLHQQPQFLQIHPGASTARATLYGTEYEPYSIPAFDRLLGDDAPCAVCYTPTRSVKITIPARTSCPPSWTREYYGYLMGAEKSSSFRSRVPVCIDVNAETIAGNTHGNFKSVLKFIETTRIGISCPPFIDGAELTCVVCTK